MQAILIHWKAAGSEDEVAVVAGLLKYPPVASTAYDLSPFFPRTATAGNKSTSGSGSAGVSQIFDGFSQLLTEMALRLPYLVKKVMPSVELDERWVECLCQYVSAPTPSAVKRHVRKLVWNNINFFKLLTNNFFIKIIRFFILCFSCSSTVGRKKSTAK